MEVFRKTVNRVQAQSGLRQPVSYLPPEIAQQLLNGPAYLLAKCHAIELIEHLAKEALTPPKPRVHRSNISMPPIGPGPRSS